MLRQTLLVDRRASCLDESDWDMRTSLTILTKAFTMPVQWCEGLEERVETSRASSEGEVSDIKMLQRKTSYHQRCRTTHANEASQVIVIIRAILLRFLA